MLSRLLVLFFDWKILKVVKKIFFFDDRLKSSVLCNNFVFIKVFCLYVINVIYMGGFYMMLDVLCVGCI